MDNKKEIKVKSNIHKGVQNNSATFKAAILAKNSLITALHQKHFLTSDYNMAIINDTLYLQLTGYIQVAKLGRYRRNIRKKRRALKKDEKPRSEEKDIKNLFLKQLNNPFLSKNIVIETKILNHLITEEKSQEYFSTFSTTHYSLFSRTTSRFIDLVRVIALFIEKKIHLRVLLQILGLTFKNLNKRQHTKYISFVQSLFDMFTKERTIKGVKLKISGKISGKTRSDSIIIESGILSLNSVSADNVSVIQHVYTNQGAFGFQMSVNYK